MSISLISDGMLHPIISIPELRAPDDPEGIMDPFPVHPCAATGFMLPIPPSVPIQGAAMGPLVPATPCGSSGTDPTIDPPAAPAGQEASETTGTEAPRVPKCPEGTKS